MKEGDTLSHIFHENGITYNTLQRILSVDQNYLHIDMIKPGELLELDLDEAGQLKKLVYNMSLVEQSIYSRKDDGSFSYEFNEVPSSWHDLLLSGQIDGSFYTSAHHLGLTPTQIANISNSLKDEVDFKHSLRNGDQFNILISKQYLENQATGRSEIKAISFKLSKGEIAAFLAQDGRFYDREGHSLERAFNRYPMHKPFRRITSPFNLRRKHPVTGKIMPHHGTDFAAPVGTPIYSIGDGQVIAIRSHPYAGNYLVIKHNSVYKTRYLHVSKFLVKKGQHVKRGQRIALSGATGRVTGPHLHFEILVHNRPVDSMKVALPMATSLPSDQKAQFFAHMNEFDALVNNIKKRG
ncbi:peptidase M23 [Terasakiispira papahanaumokuakeensis]|uniref:Peptidase M23 n=1 Tax=Terasakiispira papahanaumokuakeensis TaxID=197479 RepID=A0A1E2VFB5_9GAMM|nr:peptidase M23 [Terasakiispira papahanaumokuakeensis]